LVACLAAGLVGVALSATAADDPPPAELPPIEVFPGPDPFSEADRGLGRLRQSLPGLSEAPPPLSRGERFFQWLFVPQDLNEASELQQRMAESLDDPDAHLRKGR
jgi:hypothetical protein